MTKILQFPERRDTTPMNLPDIGWATSLWPLAGSIFFAISLIIAVPATVGFFGGFFGQRCSEIFEKPSLDWYICVERLSDGDRMSEIIQDADARK